jgi:NodT family efflux transporter outer membrane factor (OMF) lipoprotein
MDVKSRRPLTLTCDRLRWAILSFTSVIVGCAVGPDFKTPEPPTVASYSATPLPDETASADVAAGQAQVFRHDRDIPAEWWTLFQNPALDALVRQALQDNQRLAQAQARLVQAQEQFGGRKGATRYPQVDVGVSSNRINIDSDAFKTDVFGAQFPLTLSTASVSVSYTLDIFGRNRRELEGLQAAVDYEQFELEAARLMLTGNVVTAAIEEASLREQIEQTEAAVAIEAHQLEIMEGLERLGAVPAVEVVIQRSELATTRAGLPALHERLEQTRNRLAVYLGQPPAAAQLPEFRLADLRLPSELPLSVPSDLARQRPDIRAAEALLHEASAKVGVATAGLYPRITLSAQGGAIALSPLISGTPAFALLGASISQALFHGNELKAQKRSAVAALDQAGAAYHDVVLSGLENVADTLVALDADAQMLRDRADAAKLAATAYDVTSKQYNAGGVSLLAMLDAQRHSLTASVEQTKAIRDRFTDTAALFQALGGGWWATNAPEISEK